MSMLLYGLLLALAAPMFLIPVEAFIPFPYIVEEVVKLVIVLLILKSRFLNHKSPVGWIILAGALFTLSESVLYLINIFMLGDLSLFGTRLLLTGALHIGTFLILYLSSRKGLFWLLGGLVLAATIHYWYNAFVVRLVVN